MSCVPQEHSGRANSARLFLVLARIGSHRRQLIIRRVFYWDLNGLNLACANNTRRSRTNSEAL